MVGPAAGGERFRFGINTQRIRLSRLVVVSDAAIEDQIAGEKNERNVGGQFRKAGCNIDVQFAGEGWIRLTGGTCAERGAMNDELRPPFTKGPAHGGKVSQVRLAARQTDDLPSRGEVRGGLDQIISDQPAGASNPG